MQLRLGERLRCSNPECGFQVLVTDSGFAKGLPSMPRCSCGSLMKKKAYDKPIAHKVKFTREVPG
jgi:hypothetical protein